MNQSRTGGFVTPAAARIDRRPEQPSVNAVRSLSSVQPTASRFRLISVVMAVSLFATAPNTCRPPQGVSTLPTRTSRQRSLAWRLRMKLESKLMLIARLRGRRLGQGRVAKLLADFQRMMAKCFRARAGLNRQKMPQHTRGDAIAHQSGKMRLKLIQLWLRPAMRGPTHARLNPATASTKPSREPHRHSTEQSRDLMRSPVLNMAYSIAG